MFDDIRTDVSRKFLELKQWFDGINSTDDIDINFKTISRGLCNVYVYGIFEETIRSVVQRTICGLNNAHVPISQCKYELFSLAFSKEYDALFAVGREHKWQKRWDISNQLIENSILCIPNDIMPTDGKNIQYRQLESIAKSFGISESILPRSEIGGHIYSVVKARNDIAHGNKTPKEVGRETSISDMQIRLSCIREECDYVIDVYERYLTTQQYLRLSALDV